jgi:hypothetical protein
MIGSGRGDFMAKKKQPEDFSNENNKETDALVDFTSLLGKFLDLLEFTLENAEKPLKQPISKETAAQLSSLEEKVEMFCKDNEKMISEINASIDKNLLERFGAEETEEVKMQPITERAEKLKKIALEKRKMIAKIRGQPLPQDESEIAVPNEPQQREKIGKARKSLFNRVGGKKNWRPM